MSILAEGLQRSWTPQQLACLQRARIGIAGAGGLGSNVAMLLTRCGIRSFVIADHDTVDASNLNRQWYWPEDVGVLKVKALHNRLMQLEPEIQLTLIAEKITPATSVAVFSSCDIVVEALDNAAEKAALCRTLLTSGFFVVGASGLGGYGFSALRVQSLGKSFVCVGDFTSDVAGLPPLAPRVMQAAALQADAVISKLLQPIDI